ncbi:MAG: tetratricopeptide repeat protein [Pirellulales bacterium]
MRYAPPIAACLAVAAALSVGTLAAQSFDELSLERWKKLRETERYQLQIAEKYYRDKDWKVAAAEYEKFLTLYEKSDGAPYAQLKWSLAQVQLKKHNTAIKEGFQSVIDYWPDAPEAQAAAFFIGHTYRAMGQTAKAKAAFKSVQSKYSGTPAAAHAAFELAEQAATEKDSATRLSLLRTLALETPRSPPVNSICIQSARQLAALDFEAAAVDEAVKALATTCTPADLPGQVVTYAREPLLRLASSPESRPKAQKSAEAIVAYLRSVLSSNPQSDAEKTAYRQVSYGIADVLAMAQLDEKVPEIYAQLEKSLGASDEALGRLAAFYKSRMKFDDARSAYRRFGDRFEGLGWAAASYREQGQFEAAADGYRQLAAQDPERAVRWKSELATTYRQARKTMEAVAVYTELIGLDAMKQNQWRWELASTHRDAGQHREAIAHFRQCDNFPENFKQMAQCHRQLKEYNEALLLYNQIVGADANSAPWALLQIGYTREEAGQKEPAIQTFQQVCKRYPKDGHASIAHAHLQNKYKISITLGGAKDE